MSMRSGMVWGAGAEAGSMLVRGIWSSRAALAGKVGALAGFIHGSGLVGKVMAGLAAATAAYPPLVLGAVLVGILWFYWSMIRHAGFIVTVASTAVGIFLAPHLRSAVLGLAGMF